MFRAGVAHRPRKLSTITIFKIWLNRLVYLGCSVAALVQVIVFCLITQNLTFRLGAAPSFPALFGHECRDTLTGHGLSS